MKSSTGGRGVSASFPITLIKRSGECCQNLHGKQQPGAPRGRHSISLPLALPLTWQHPGNRRLEQRHQTRQRCCIAKTPPALLLNFPTRCCLRQLSVPQEKFWRGSDYSRCFVIALDSTSEFYDGLSKEVTPECAPEAAVWFWFHKSEPWGDL